MQHPSTEPGPDAPVSSPRAPRPQRDAGPSDRSRPASGLTVTMVGLGYVGSVTAACLAHLGHHVIGVDADPIKTAEIERGRAPVAEPTLDELMAAGVGSGAIRLASLAGAVAASDLVMISVGTPSAPGGGLDATVLDRVSREIGAALPRDRRFRVVVLRSTALPDMVDVHVRQALEAASGRRAGIDFGFAVNPESLREGSGVNDFFAASRIIIGSDDERSRDLVERLYADLGVPIEHASPALASLAKYADNAFHALKIAFANELADLARRYGLDGRELLRLLITDERLNLSAAYLRPGFAFGGSCLPKDLRALEERGRKLDVELPLVAAIRASNRAHFERCLDLVEAAGGRRVGLLGLSFKGATDDLRESPAVALAERLVGRGYQLAIFDDDVRTERLRGANRAFIDRHLPHLGRLLVPTPPEAVEGRDTIVVTKATTSIARALGHARAGQTVVDLVGIGRDHLEPGPAYVGAGW